MNPIVERADFSDPSLASFLQAHLDDIAPTAPESSRHALDAVELMDPSVRLWVIQDGIDVVTTGALAPLAPSHEELKSMRTAPTHRGRGLARAVLEHALEDAKSRGVSRVSLETGTMEFFAPARRLYAAAGFEVCPPFGDYCTDPNSTFMTLALS